MYTKKLMQKIALTVATLLFMTVFFTACHRGYGCPGQADLPPQQEVEQLVEQNC